MDRVELVLVHCVSLMPSADLTTAANSPEDLLKLQKQLTTTAEQLRGSNSEGGDELWQDVTRISRTLANALRVTDGPGMLQSCFESPRIDPVHS